MTAKKKPAPFKKILIALPGILWTVSSLYWTIRCQSQFCGVKETIKDGISTAKGSLLTPMEEFFVVSTDLFRMSVGALLAASALLALFLLKKGNRNKAFIKKTAWRIWGTGLLTCFIAAHLIILYLSI